MRTRTNQVKPINKAYQWLAGAAALLFASLAIFSYQPEVAIEPADTSPRIESPSPFATLKLEAQAAIVYEPDRGRTLFARSADRTLAMASVTKIMTALATEELLLPGTKIAFEDHFWDLRQLIDYTLVTSSNQAAVVLATTAEAITGQNLLSEMNRLAATLKLESTRFRNVTGLDLPEGKTSSVSSARDIANLLTYVLVNRPELLEATRQASLILHSFDGVRQVANNTNIITNELPGLLASKTGFTDLAQGNLAVVVDRGLNQPIIIVVLGSSETGRFADTKKLLDATMTFFSS